MLMLYFLRLVSLCYLFTVATANECSSVFHKYTSSPLEQKWIENVQNWQADLCKHITNDEMKWWIKNVSMLSNDAKKAVATTMSPEPPTNEWSYLFPVFTYKRNCVQKLTNASRTEYVHISIEPTAAIARDPRKCWEPNTEKYTQSKEYLLPLSLKAALTSAMKTRASKAVLNHQGIATFLFDAGATFPGQGTSTEGNDWSGTEWIYNWYSQRGIVFDHIYAWEPSEEDYSKNHLSPALAKALHYFNVGITDGPKDEHNPLAVIRQKCKPEDIVVFKLDIDNDIELNIAQQLLSDPELLSLVDEFYFEHHVNNPLMAMHGLDKESPIDLKSWYDMVIPARQKGLHMHFWP